MKIAGLDIGTTGCKCTVFDENGKYLGKSYRNYPVKRNESGHEIDASVVMEEVYTCIREMVKQYPDIKGIGVTSFGETFCCTDENGNVLLASMLYTDPRGFEQCKKLVDKLGEKKIAKITGLRSHEMYSISKIMWIKENAPEIYEKIKHIFLMQDYVVYQLTGTAQIDYSLATRTMAFDIEKLDWSEEIFQTAGIKSTLMSKPVPTGTIAGTVTECAKEKTGLALDTKIISVSHDQIAAAVGAGVFDGKEAADGAGTVECLSVISDGIPDLEKLYKGYFAVVPYVVKGKYVVYAFSYTGGALLQWCVDSLAKKEKETARQLKLSINEYLEMKYKETAGNMPLKKIMVLPHFAGAATPYMDNEAKGAILGLTMHTSVAEIYRGCMEGITYEMYLNMCALNDAGIKVDKLYATGGGAHSKIWMQMKADVLNVSITALKTVDAGTVGSAMLTGIAIGLFKNLGDAAEHMIEKTESYEPCREMHEKYMNTYTRYRNLYHTVKPLM